MRSLYLFRPGIRVARTRASKERKLTFIQVDQAPMLQCVLRCSRPVLGIIVFIPSLAVMENGEILDHGFIPVVLFCKEEAVLANAQPM